MQSNKTLNPSAQVKQHALQQAKAPKVVQPKAKRGTIKIAFENPFQLAWQNLTESQSLPVLSTLQKYANEASLVYLCLFICNLFQIESSQY